MVRVGVVVVDDVVVVVSDVVVDWVVVVWLVELEVLEVVDEAETFVVCQKGRLPNGTPLTPDV